MNTYRKRYDSMPHCSINLLHFSKVFIDVLIKIRGVISIQKKLDFLERTTKNRKVKIPRVKLESLLILYYQDWLVFRFVLEIKVLILCIRPILRTATLKFILLMGIFQKDCWNR
jgi:hypothetical protein